MSEKRCPICGEPVPKDECFSCGYIFPDLDKLTAPYDLDPSNVLFGEAAEEDASASDLPDMDSLGAPDISLLKKASEERQAGAAFKSVQAGAFPNIQVRPSAAPPAVVPQNPAAPQPAQQTARQTNQQPYPFQNGYSASDVGTGIVRAVVDFVTAHWWQLLLMLTMPPTGMIFGFFYIAMGRLNSEFKKTFLGTAFIILSILLMIAGVDPFNMNYFFLSFFT